MFHRFIFLSVIIERFFWRVRARIFIERDVPRLTQPTDIVASYQSWTQDQPTRHQIRYNRTYNNNDLSACAIRAQRGPRLCHVDKIGDRPPSLADCYGPYDTAGGCRAVAAHCSVPNATPHVKYLCFFFFFLFLQKKSTIIVI